MLYNFLIFFIDDQEIIPLSSQNTYWHKRALALYTPAPTLGGKGREEKPHIFTEQMPDWSSRTGSLTHSPSLHDIQSNMEKIKLDDLLV